MQYSEWRARCARILVLVFSALLACSAGAQDIVVGQIGPFTVLPTPDAKEVNAGIMACFAEVNARGGIRGRKLSLFELDDKFNKEEFVRQFELAMQRKPVAMMSPIGSPSVQALLQSGLLDRNDVVVINAVAGAETLRKPGHPRLFYIRASDRLQIEKIIGTAQSMGIAKLQMLYQNIPIGAAAMATATEIGKREHGKIDVGGLESKPDEASLAEAARRLMQAHPQSVIVVGSPRFMADAAKQVRQAGLTGFVFALSYLSPAILNKVAGGALARGVSITQAYPNPMGVLPLNQEFKQAMQALDPTLQVYTAFHLEGYLSARVLVEGLKKAGGDFRPESLGRALRELGDINLGGFHVDFSRSNEGSHFVDIGIVSADGRLRY